MGRIDQEEFICLDCETTGLDIKKDRIIEVAAVRFTMGGVLDRYESLINPECLISPESMAIHHISDEMVQGKPTIKEVLPSVLEFVGNYPIVGHGILFDIGIIHEEAKRAGVSCFIQKNSFIDTLRMARMYGRSPDNSLEMLRKHFHIEEEGAHRAMNDVVVNIEVFRRLSSKYQDLAKLYKDLSRPIALRAMPLGKHKGRKFKEVPLNYLRWAANKDFDEDLLFSIRSELKRRKGGNAFGQSTNPFQDLEL